MAQPYNYILDVPNPLESLNQGLWNGFKLGANIDQVKKQQEQYDLQKQQQTQMNQSLQYLAQNPSPENYAKVMTMYPQLSENLKRSYDTMDDGKRKTTLSIASQSYAALMNNQPDVAKQVLNDAATAYENSGQTKDAGVIRGYAKLIDNNPAAARTSIGLMMASTDPDKFKDIYGTLGSEQRANEMQPVDIAQKEAQTNKTIAETNDIPLAAEDRRKGVENQQRDIDLENQYKQQQLFFEKNKPVSFGVDIKGRKYAVMPNGDARYVKDAQGNYITDVKSEKPMTATMQKELFETDDAIASSQSVISNLKEALRLSPISYDGLNADMRASVAGNLGIDKERSKNTAMLNNIMTSNALDALKSTFGAAPTEGERKILLDIQGSVNLPAKQREAIYERALQAANKRLTMNQKKAEAIRNGSYTSSEYNKSQSTQSKQGTKPAARSFFD
ncbi:hypothetical protein [Acinetobacter ursingii]|uniref:hypothetical protein n=1 Tax=Acinetobacter ursingii TaxID=108980 RepID=UPI003008C920